MAQRDPEPRETSQIAIVDVATGTARVVAGEHSVDVGARWLADGSLLYVSDADGWFQVVHLTADGRDRVVLTSGKREHGEPGGGVGYVPLPSPDGRRFVHIEVHDGLQDLLVGELPAGCRRQARPRAAAQDAADGVARRGGTADQSVGRRLAFGRLARRTGPGWPRSARARRGRRISGCSPSRAWRPPEHARAR